MGVVPMNEDVVLSASKEKFNDVSRPRHYANKNIEVIDFIVDTLKHPKDYCIGNVIKYISRHELKGNPLQDLQKAMYYLQKAIELLERQ